MPASAVRRLSPLLLVLLAAACDDQESYEPEAASDTASDTPTDAGGSAAPAGATLRTVSPQEAFELLQDPPEGLVVLDVRTAGEFERGHLEGAIQLDFYGDDFEQQVDALDKDVPYLLYCQSGGRSASTLATMGNLGFREVYEIDGGYGAWSAAGLPVVEP